MTYKVTIAGKAYVLPARTLSVDDKIESLCETDRLYQSGEISRREAVERLHGFAEALVPGSMPAIDEVDTNELMKVCLEIVAAYNAPAQKARAEASLSQVKEILAKPELQKLLAIAELHKK